LPLLFALLQSCASAPTPALEPAAPHHAMVVAANPLAAQAGIDVLRAGGSAADAAVAIQSVLGLVEPQSSGLGGGAFISYYDAATRRVRAYNGRETAPAGATADMFLGEDHQPLSRATGVLSGRSTGVPGAVAALSLLQREHGKLKWRDLFGSAGRLATEGFVVSPRLASFIVSRAPSRTLRTSCVISANRTAPELARAICSRIPPTRRPFIGSRSRARARSTMARSLPTS
jgi:gamma-glutamyltranspeptidase / glutathione hydrolase